MLELRPNCELCDKDLPAESSAAMICTYECTFCRDCVEKVLLNVCPNCGGGFEARPVRPSQARRAGLSVMDQPASQQRVLTKYSEAQIVEFSQSIAAIPPNKR